MEVMDVMMFKQYPKDKKKMLEEIKKAFDAYDNDEIDDEAFIPLLFHYEAYSRNEAWLGTYRGTIDSNNLTDTFVTNKATADRLGKKRTRRLEKILEKTIEFE